MCKKIHIYHSFKSFHSPSSKVMKSNKKERKKNKLFFIVFYENCIIFFLMCWIFIPLKTPNTLEYIKHISKFSKFKWKKFSIFQIFSKLISDSDLFGVIMQDRISLLVDFFFLQSFLLFSHYRNKEKNTWADRKNKFFSPSTPIFWFENSRSLWSMIVLFFFQPLRLFALSKKISSPIVCTAILRQQRTGSSNSENIMHVSLLCHVDALFHVSFKHHHTYIYVRNGVE